MGTPTFLRTYARRIEPDSLNRSSVVVGAEKMPLDLFETFEKQFGVRPIEGYGATEPVRSCGESTGSQSNHFGS